MEDLGYTDYAWYGQLTVQKIFFVTRQKSNARYRVLARRPVKVALGLEAKDGECARRAGMPYLILASAVKTANCMSSPPG